MNANEKFQAKRPLHGDGYLAPFIGVDQRIALMDLMDGEEGEYFAELVKKLQAHIEAMPKSYETEGQGMAAVVQLHYFVGGYDSWITEKDRGDPVEPDNRGQHQAYGAVRHQGDDPELGYVSIEQAITHGAELDLYWTPKTLKEIM